MYISICSFLQLCISCLYYFSVKLGENRWLSSNKSRDYFMLFFYAIFLFFFTIFWWKLKKRMGTEQVESTAVGVLVSLQAEGLNLIKHLKTC